MTDFKTTGRVGGDNEARTGLLTIPGRKTMQTPHYIAISSRGTVPHITQDMLRDQTSISAVYAGLEESGILSSLKSTVDKKLTPEDVEQLPTTPPFALIPCSEDQSPLRKFVSLQEEVLLILGPRRLPPLAPATPNSFTSITINTPKGYRQLEILDYISFGINARPDVLIGPSDVELGDGAPLPGSKRKDKMDERTTAWMRGMQKALAKSRDSLKAHLWAPILPIEPEMQRSYLAHLETSGTDAFAGLALYEESSILAIPDSFLPLPRLSLAGPSNPHAILRSVSLGLDLVAIPFVTRLTEAGLALTFEFPAPVTESKLPLGFSLWPSAYATDLMPLDRHCTCHTCTTTHRAFIHHLLDAREMTAWVLLQVHNYRRMDDFFASIRASIQRGTFETDIQAFGRAYADEWPGDGGEGPRLRGYQLRNSKPGPKRANQPARKRLEKADTEAIEAVKAERARRRLDDQAQKIAEAIETDVLGISALGFVDPRTT